MVAPPASSKPRFLEKVARSTLVLCHAFPQERPTGRSGTASAGSGKSAAAEDPSFSRNDSWRLGRLFTAGAAPILPTDKGFVYQTQRRSRRPRPVVAACRRRSRADALQRLLVRLLYSTFGVPQGSFRV
jgi:hypothetical protein